MAQSRPGLRARGLLLLAAAVLAMAAPGSAPAAGEPPLHQLTLDSGGHRAFVNDIAFSPDGELLVSASDDKTVRVWDWRAGVTLRTLRHQIGDGNEGKVFAVAVSPDGGTIATGGYFGPGIGDAPPYGDIRLFDLKTGRIRAVLKGLEQAVLDIAFSPDGAFLAAGGDDGFVQVWRRDAAQDTGWALHGTLDADSWRVREVAFALGGKRLAVATADNGARLFDMEDGSEIEMPEAEALRDAQLSAMAVSPDGETFATGDDSGEIHLWRAADGSLAATLPSRGHRIGALAFAGDGARLVASCGYRCDGDWAVAVFSLAAPQAPPLLYAGHDNTVYAAATAPEGLVATAGGDRHEIHVWNPQTGEARRIMHGTGAPVTAVGVSADGGVVAWGTQNPCPGEDACPDRMGALEAEFLLPTPDRGFESPTPLGAGGEAFRRAAIEDGEWTLRHAEGGENRLPNAVLEILRGGEIVRRIENDATNGYLHGAYTLLSDGSHLVTGGSDGTLIAYERETGRFAGEFAGGHFGAVTAMAEAPAAHLLVTGGADQTVRLWNLQTKTLVASLFASGEDWIVWTPQGYFYSSPNGDALVGWHINQGQDKEGRYIKARQLRQHLNSPEIVRRAILTGDPAGAARELRGTDRQLEQLLQRKPPEFEARVVETDPPAAEGYVAVEIVGADEAGAGVAAFSVLANDRRIAELAPRAAGDGRMVIEVPVGEGENEILISGVNEFGYVTERGVKALAKKTASEKPKGKLYVVAVGINDYPHLATDCGGRSCDLRFPVADAAEFLRVVAERTAPLHAQMEALLLVNREALETNATLAGEIARIVDDARIVEPEARTVRDEITDFLDLPGPDDTTIVFIAGHGINVDEDYYVVPTDARKQDGDRWRRSSLVAWSDIQEAIERAKGRRFMLLDTCHAAGAFNAKLEKEAADARIVVLAATAANNTAAELGELGHGAFTWSVIEGLRGAANTGGDGVRILGLSDYVDREVRRLTADRQQPFYHLPRTENFLVARP